MKNILILIASSAIMFTSCQKDFLDKKSSQNQKVPESLADFQALFDNSTGTSNPMNARSSHLLGIIGADEYFLSEIHFNGLAVDGVQAYARNGYIWAKDVYTILEGVHFEPYDFSTAYNRVLRCNIVLEGLGKIDKNRENEQEWNNIKGSAHFYRALDYYNLCQLYAVPLGLADGESMGMPLRTTSDPTLKVDRSSLYDTYNLIDDDLQIAEELLPIEGINVFRPSKLAVYALRARIYLQQENYQAALQMANKIFSIRQKLSDYNDIPVTSNYSFPLYGIGNPEVFFSTAAHNAPILSHNMLQVDSLLYEAFDTDDLRRSLFFKKSTDGRVNFWGSYYGNNLFFTGFALDEIYLIRAEALAREGDLFEACEALNLLLKSRYKSDTYTDFSSNNQYDVLTRILHERRKQLIFRGVRWEDLRRLNLHSETSKLLLRKLGNQQYELPPNSVRYVWPLPPEAVLVGGYKQNER